MTARYSRTIACVHCAGRSWSPRSAAPRRSGRNCGSNCNSPDPRHAPCGSEPARDGGGPACIDVGCAAAIASRLAPTGFYFSLQTC
ncbi:hypothetical protein CRX69_13220 [Pseudomonas rhizophila]|uniref:Uncharacterized protein n=1 Tax=Pseudomonas rhizophila TaxID=2045200 RepID=A0ABM6UF85_9PSED|nr:hypothetical protein CRX69_13220 [Pseudomonas rhizophila]